VELGISEVGMMPVKLARYGRAYRCGLFGSVFLLN